MVTRVNRISTHVQIDFLFMFKVRVFVVHELVGRGALTNVSAYFSLLTRTIFIDAVSLQSFAMFIHEELVVSLHLFPNFGLLLLLIRCSEQILQLVIIGFMLLLLIRQPNLFLYKLGLLEGNFLA